MKKIVLPIIALLAMIFPLLTGCGEKGETYNVEVVLEKAQATNSADNNFRLLDCARATGAGEYAKGSEATIVVEIVDACEIEEWVIDGEVSSTYTANKATRKVTVDSDKKVVVKIKKNNANVQEGIYAKFLGFSVRADALDSYHSLDDSVTSVALPQSNSDRSVGILYDKNGATPVEERSLKFSGLIKKYYLSETLGSTDEIDINYVYFNGAIQLATVKWQLATYDKSEDSCSDWTDANPNSDVPNSVCFRALVDKGASVKKDGLSKMKTSEMYVSVGDACIGATRATAVSKDCFYVINAQKLINNNAIGDTLYYGLINDQNGTYLESVSSSSNLYYTICVNNMNGGSCREEDTYRSEFIGRDKLAIKQFLLDIDDEADVSHVTEWKYEHNLNTIVPAKIVADTREYNIIYFGNGATGQYANPTIKFDNLNTAVAAKFYQITANSNDTTIETAINKLNGEFNKLYNRFYPISHFDDNDHEILRRKVFALVNNDSDLAELKNYIVAITVTDSNISIAFTKDEVIVNTDHFGPIKETGKLTIVTGNTSNATAYYEDTTYASMVLGVDSGVYETILKLINGDNRSSMNVKDIFVSEANISYEIDNLTYVFSYNENTYTISVISASGTKLLGVMSKVDESVFEYDRVDQLDGNNSAVIAEGQLVALDGDPSTLEEINGILKDSTFYLYDTGKYVLIHGDNAYYLSASGNAFAIIIDSAHYQVSNTNVSEVEEAPIFDLITADVGGFIDDDDNLVKPTTHLLAINNDVDVLILTQDGDSNIDASDEDIGSRRVQTLISKTTDSVTKYYSIAGDDNIMVICYTNDAILVGDNRICKLVSKDTDNIWHFYYNEQEYKLSIASASHILDTGNTIIDIGSDYKIIASVNLAGVPVTQILTFTKGEDPDSDITTVTTSTMINNMPEQILNFPDTNIKDFNNILRSSNLYEINSGSYTYMVLKTTETTPNYYLVTFEEGAYVIHFEKTGLEEYSQEYKFTNNMSYMS